jgi:hypothetical protein
MHASGLRQTNDFRYYTKTKFLIKESNQEFARAVGLLRGACINLPMIITWGLRAPTQVYTGLAREKDDSLT